MEPKPDCIICKQPVIFSGDYHGSCLSTLKHSMEVEYDNKYKVCSECGKEIHISYSQHKGLHALCWREWKSKNPGKVWSVPKFEFNESIILEEYRTKYNNEKESLNQQKQYGYNASSDISYTTTQKATTTSTSGTVDEADRILQSSNFYEILMVSKQNSDGDQFIELVQKHYKKIALKVHPDKNSHPQSERAFKLLSDAKECLINPEMKQKYDNLISSSKEIQLQQLILAMNLYDAFKKFF
eukprot:TRINITY_DN7298_c0_g1_i3.p1 TRINITY_DN7298_c0_g1~~TRINITY_DN7298_c0_g1_i3.p1  ORF type:complete len:241 (-),score=35.66 TRINITY_DN7298_c0_g1_i3:16-738(-)